MVENGVPENLEPSAAPEEEDTQQKRIDELLDGGYTPMQIEKEWGFPHSTVFKYAKKRITPKATAKEEDQEIPKLPMEIPRMPLVLKVGTGHEMISPEGILQSYLLSDGDAGAWMFKGMMLLRAAQLMNLTDEIGRASCRERV